MRHTCRRPSCPPVPCSPASRSAWSRSAAASRCPPRPAPSGGTGGAQPQASPTPAPAPRSAPSLPPVRSKVQLTRLACASGVRRERRRPPGRAAARARHEHAPHRRGALRRRRRATRTTSPPRPSSAARPRSTCACRSAPPAARSRCSTATACSPRPRPRRSPSSSRAAAMPAAGGPSIDVDVQAPKAYFDAARPMRVSYVVHDDRPVNVRVELVRVADQAVIASWAPGVVQPETPQLVQWNGMAGGRVQKPGRYVFRVSSRRRGRRAARLERAGASPTPRRREPDPAAFTFLRHTFPVLGPHGYGEFAAKFGGGRGHQGQDVFAACGTPMVAARGGDREVQAVPLARRLLPRDRRRAHRHRLRLHAPARGRAGRTRASACAPAS